MGTTPNYSWPYPESSDYVADGATAIENLADAADASLLSVRNGLIVQQGHSSVSSAVVNSTTTLAATGLSVTITPRSTSNLIYLFFTVPCFKGNGNAYNSVQFAIAKNGTHFFYQNGYLYDGNSTTVTQGQWTFTGGPYSITSLSAVTYSLSFANHPYGSGQVQISPSTGAGYQLSTMNVWEVAQ